MDNPNITMEEYIRLEEEKAHRCGKVYNWETTKYGKIWYDEDVHELRSVETKFPAIVFNDELSSEKTLSCEPTVSSLNNNEIDFIISFDESDDEDYMVIFDKNSFSYKIISVNDLKTNSENDNEKVNMPSFPSPEPTVIYFDDLNFFKDFENEFPAIIYNDALTSKSDFLTEPTLKSQHIDEFDLKDETSLSEYDEVEQNVLYFNDLKAIRHMAPLPPHDQRHLWLHYQVKGYIEEIVHDFEQRLKTIFRRQVNQVHILDFEGLTPDMRQDLAERLRMVYTGDDGQEIFMSHSWRRHAEGRKRDAKLSGGHFIGRLAHHFGLVSNDRLRGLSIVTRELPLIDMGELVKLNIYVDEGAQAGPAPIHAPPPPAPAAGRTMP
ncbi:hypothetical protein Tco_1379482 [Tanacetum coccineum]